MVVVVGLVRLGSLPIHPVRVVPAACTAVAVAAADRVSTARPTMVPAAVAATGQSISVSDRCSMLDMTDHDWSRFWELMHKIVHPLRPLTDQEKADDTRGNAQLHGISVDRDLKTFVQYNYGYPPVTLAGGTGG